MQSLWSRASWAHRCGCRACSTAVNSIGKRTTARVGRRKPTFTEIFTACYSSMFATAAVVDAIRKEDRRQDLDRQLTEMRRELAELRAGDASKTDGLDFDMTELPIEQMDSLYKTLKLIHHSLPPLQEVHRSIQNSQCDFVARLKRDHFGLPSEEALREMLEMDYGRLERAIMREEGSQFQHRMPKNEIQIQRDSKSIVHVVQQLLQRAHIMERDWTSFDIPRDIKDIGKADFPRYDYHHSDCPDARRNTRMLNKSIRQVLGNKQLERKEQVSRICFNLLVSRYPPDIHTYNTLIVAFNRSGDHALAEALVNSFFNCRLLRPTPSTYVAILNHYKCTGNHGLFLKTLSRITGADASCGGKIRRRHVDDVASDPELTGWARDTRRVTLTGDWYWEHVPLNRPMVEAMIHGLLRFKLFDQAASLFVSCVQAGVTLGARTVRVLLDSCINALDLRAASRLLTGLNAQGEHWPLLLAHLGTATMSYIMQRLSDVSELCGLAVGSDLRHGLYDLAKEQGSPLHGSLQQLQNILADDIVDSVGALSRTDNKVLAASRSRLLRIESMLAEYSKISQATQRLSEGFLASSLSLQTRQLSVEILARHHIKQSNKLRKEALHALYGFLHSSDLGAEQGMGRKQRVLLLTTVGQESLRYNRSLEVWFRSLMDGVSRNSARESLTLAKQQDKESRVEDDVAAKSGSVKVDNVTSVLQERKPRSVAKPCQAPGELKVPSGRLGELWTVPAVRRLWEARA